MRTRQTKTSEAIYRILVVAVVVMLGVQTTHGGQKVDITSPSDGTTVHDTVPIGVSVLSGGVDAVDFLIDGTSETSMTSSPTLIWDMDSTELSNGVHTISIVALNPGGNQIDTDAITVNVQNGSGPPSPTPSPTSTPTSTPTPTNTPTPTPTPVGLLSNIVVVMEENTEFTSVFPADCAPPNCTSSSMPHLASLVNHPPTGINSAMAEQYDAIGHPSACNLSIWGGRYDGALGQNCSITGSCSNCSDSVAGCFPNFPAGPWNSNQAGKRITEDDVSNELAAHGKTWKSYAEDYPGINSCGGSLYAARHNPPINFADVANDQPGNVVDFSQFAIDAAADKLPNFALIVPNTCDDAHDGGTNCGLSHADAWLQTNVITPLFGAGGPPAFQSGGGGVLIVTFDEGTTRAPCTTNCPSNPQIAGGGNVVFTLSGALIKPAATDTILYQHPSLTRLILEGFGIASLPGDAGKAPSLTFFLQ